MASNGIISNTAQAYPQTYARKFVALDRVVLKENQQNLRVQMEKLNQQHQALVKEELQVKEQLKDNEEKRIEVNKRMSRPGQIVDKTV